MQTLENINYIVLPEDQVRNYVVHTCEKEWDAGDFPKYGEELYNSKWRLEEVEVEKITVNNQMLNSETFLADVTPRIKKQEELFAAQTPIPPLILRGKDNLIFDGYARYLFFKSKGIKKCLAYVSY